MRQTNEYGLPESSEYNEALNQLFCSIDRKMQKNAPLSREEIALHDVYSAIGHIEGDGLPSFWIENDHQDRKLESFYIIGAGRIADILKNARWVSEVAESHGYYQFSKQQEEHLKVLEERTYELFIGLPTKLLEFANVNGISH